MKTKILWFSVVLVTIWAMKRYYADARADDLRWILDPTARVAGALTGTAFEVEPGAGYLARDRMFLIEKSCAGINFMIAAFGLVAFVWRERVRSWSSGVRALAMSLLVSYAAAVVVNGTRVAIALSLASHGFTLSSASAAQIHRLEGITVSFCGLMLLHEIVMRLDRRMVFVRHGS